MPGGFHTTHGISVDISEGGISAIVEADLQIGETVEIDIPLKSGALNTVAILRHVTRSRSGFEFLGLTADERQQIAAASSII
jgi:PilZ domain-containing protein